MTGRATWRALSLAAAVTLTAIPANASVSCATDAAILTTPSGARMTIAVEIADDAAERAQGLMGRRELPAGQGMLFVYETPRPASFWMKNTLIPLDMLFFDARGVLRHVHPNARPHDLTPVPGATPGDPDPDRLLVLEIAGGEAARLGLRPKTTLSHPAVPQKSAAAPCD